MTYCTRTAEDTSAVERKAGLFIGKPLFTVRGANDKSMTAYLENEQLLIEVVSEKITERMNVLPRLIPLAERWVSHANTRQPRLSISASDVKVRPAVAARH